VNKLLLIIFSLAFILRISLLFVAYHGDLNNNISWGTMASEKGLNGFYEGKTFSYSSPNQPPLTILMFVGLRVIWQTIENVSWFLNNNLKIFPSQFIWFWEQKGMILLVKLPSIIADLGIGYLIYRYFSDRKKYKIGLKLAVIWLFNPITWYNSAIWGQTDSIVNLLGLLSVLYLLKKNLKISLLFLALCLLFKSSLAIFVPIILFVAFLQRYPIREWLTSSAYCLITIALISICFHPQFDLPIWLFNLYKGRILSGEIGSLTANAFNFWWLVDPGKTLDSKIFFGIPAYNWGLIIVILSITSVLLFLKQKTRFVESRLANDKRLFMSFALLSLISFLFMTRIHERYLYPFFPYATLLVGLIPGFIIPYIILSMTHLLNLYHLFWAPSIPWLEKLYVNSQFQNGISLVNLLVFAWLIFTFLRLSEAKKL